MSTIYLSGLALKEKKFKPKGIEKKKNEGLKYVKIEQLLVEPPI